MIDNVRQTDTVREEEAPYIIYIAPGSVAVLIYATCQFCIVKYRTKSLQADVGSSPESEKNLSVLKLDPQGRRK